jgi:hypothetical protein
MPRRGARCARCRHPAHRRLARLGQSKALGERAVEPGEIGRHRSNVALQNTGARLVDPPLEALMELVQTRDLAGDLG